MFQEVEKDPFFNGLQVYTSPGIRPGGFGITNLKFIIRVGDETVERAFVPDGDDLRLLDARKDPFAPLYFANPRGRMDASYEIQMTTQTGTFISSISKKSRQLVKFGIVNLDLTPDKSGINFLNIDVSQMLFADEFQQHKKDNPDTEHTIKELPRFITVSGRQSPKRGAGGRSREFRRKIVSDDKFGNYITWPIDLDGGPVTVKIQARGYRAGNSIRDFELNSSDDIRENPDGLLLVLTNSSFD